MNVLQIVLIKILVLEIATIKKLYKDILLLAILEVVVHFVKMILILIFVHNQKLVIDPIILVLLRIPQTNVFAII